jgi:hypothetical protein
MIPIRQELIKKNINEIIEKLILQVGDFSLRKNNCLNG